MQSWYSSIIDLFHSLLRRFDYPRCSLLDFGYEDTVDKAAQLRSAYRRQEKCVLFSKLQGELRNNVYELLLVSDENITPAQRLLGSSKTLQRAYDSGPGRAAGLDATLLRTCRAIHYEALPILYEENTFEFNKVMSMWRIEETPCILSRIFFGTDPVFRWEGPFTLLRRVSLNMIPKGMMIGRPLSENFCDLDFAILLMSISGFPSLDYLDLDFNSLICTEPDRLMVLRAIGLLKTYGPKRDDGTAVGLRKLTIKGLDDKPLLEELQYLVAPWGKYVVE